METWNKEVFIAYVINLSRSDDDNQSCGCDTQAAFQEPSDSTTVVHPHRPTCPGSGSERAALCMGLELEQGENHSTEELAPLALAAEEGAMKSQSPSFGKALLGLSVPCVALAYHVGQPLRWFSWHPFLMLLGFVVAGGSGILAKRKGGRYNTLVHGYAMSASFVLSLLGWYVIHEQKKMLGKPHLTSWHSWAGVAATLGYLVAALIGGVLLHPDFGMARTNQNIRFVHKMASRCFTAIACRAASLEPTQGCPHSRLCAPLPLLLQLSRSAPALQSL
jgi:hypothetical protein